MYVDGLLACVEQHSQALGSSDETAKPHSFLSSVYGTRKSAEQFTEPVSSCR